MAKIILVSKKITATSWQLAQALRSQQHEVVMLTSYGEEPLGELRNIEFMAYFKKWSFLEGIKIIPGLFGLQPQILHLVLEEDKMSPAQIVLSTFAKSHPSCVLTTSLLNIRFGLRRTNPVRYLVEESDIITCPTVETLGQLRGLNVKANQQGRGILPPALDFSKSAMSETYADGSEARLIADLADEEYFVVPFRESRFRPDSASFVRLRTLAQKHKVALWGSYSHWPLRDRKQFAAWMEKYDCGNRWVVTGSLAPHLTKILLERATAFVLAGQRFTPVEMTEYYLRAIQSQAIMVLDSKQTSVHADLWKNTVNCWVLNHEHIQRDLVKLLSRPHLRLPEVLSEQRAQNSHLIDSSLNELNRLYNKALSHLR
ncbi:hypothetical protein [Bdellovibrio sp. NC01]|uniref:hypothetical protein n=1 Tax=Bdellovibrio sp. NC01 TaxID=2220073 RepID=UPI0011592C7A|nr:hypothetical protein [Bdellovibrio sp. NC01]QDK36739.1 hypothetical protein DOE51_03545 [Bdellovibrio sp. NC01]